MKCWQTVQVWLCAVTITISQVSRKISYQLTFCQHVPSKFDFKKSLQSLIFPTSGPVQQSYKEAVKGTVRMAAAVGSNSSTCRPVPGRQVIIISPCSGTMTSLSLFLCIAGWYTVCSFFIYLPFHLVLYLLMYLFARVFNVCTHTCTRGITWKMNMHMCLSMPWHLTCYRRAISILKSQPAFISYNVLTL